MNRLMRIVTFRVALAFSLCLLASVIGSCAQTDMRSGETETFRRYWRKYADGLAELRKIKGGAHELERIRQAVSAMSDSRIEWLIRNDYAPGWAHDAEWANQHSFVTRGTDWTRYAMLPNGMCTTGEDCARQQHIIAARKCAAYSFRVIVGRVERSGRQMGLRPSHVVGVVPFGVWEYRGYFRTKNGGKLPVTWSQRWFGGDRDARTVDPLDNGPHRFALQRLPGAENWEIALWSGMPEPSDDPVLSPANCTAQLGAWPSVR